MSATVTTERMKYCGPFDPTARQAKHQPDCDGCGDPSEIIWKDDLRNSDTWFYQKCKTCGGYVCGGCYDELPDGTPECHRCYSYTVRAERAEALNREGTR